MQTILPPLKPLRRDGRTDAIERLMAIEDSLHALIRACDAAGLKPAADELERIATSHQFDDVYKALTNGK